MEDPESTEKISPTTAFVVWANPTEFVLDWKLLSSNGQNTSEEQRKRTR
jgi:hypothetical protein